MWIDDQNFEKNWWGNCANTYSEETKQLTYANKMGLVAKWDYGHFPSYDLQNQSILDVGGGAVSILLKCKNYSRAVVVDPCPYPQWTKVRYAEIGIDFRNIPAEDMEFTEVFDEVWCYNVLQHTQDPQLIVSKMLRFSKLIRMFEWVNEPVSIGHPHTLKEKELNEWLGGTGYVETLNQNHCVGDAYYGLFKGNHFLG